MIKMYDLGWFSNQQPDLSYFARDEQRTTWGGGDIADAANDQFQASIWSKNL